MKAIIFMPEFKSISGSRALSRDLIRSSDGRDLNQVLASTGTIQILPKEAVRSFGTARKAIETTLLAKGTRFFGGFLVSEENAAEVNGSLEKIREQVLSARERLADDLPSIIESRAKELPEWADVIRNTAPTREDIQEGIHFGWIKTVIDLTDPQVVEVLQGNPLQIKIAKEISQMAISYLGRPAASSPGKNGIPGLGTLNAVATKAAALGFLDPRFRDLHASLLQVIKDAKEPNGSTLLTVRGVLKLLSDPKVVLDFDPVEALPKPELLAEEPEAQEPEDSDDEIGEVFPMPTKTTPSRVLDWAF